MVVAELGSEDTKNPYWLATMQKKEKILWDALSVDEKAVYSKMAKAINEGTQAKEAKIECVFSVCRWSMSCVS